MCRRRGDDHRLSSRTEKFRTQEKWSDRLFADTLCTDLLQWAPPSCYLHAKVIKQVVFKSSLTCWSQQQRWTSSLNMLGERNDWINLSRSHWCSTAVSKTHTPSLCHCCVFQTCWKFCLFTRTNGTQLPQCRNLKSVTSLRFARCGHRTSRQRDTLRFKYFLVLQIESKLFHHRQISQYSVVGGWVHEGKNTMCTHIYSLLLHRNRSLDVIKV